MREIIFRGKRLDNGEWSYGYYYSDCDCFDRAYFIISPKADPDDSSHTYEVDPETVGQYTGLRDRNSKEIFEGDIIEYEVVEYEDKAPGQVGYDGHLIMNRGVIRYDAGSFYCTNTVATILQDSIYEGFANCTVIGNIYDNPELVGAEQ